MIRLAGLPGLLIAMISALLWAPAFAAAPAGPQFPELSGRVVDAAHVLSPQVQADLTAKLAALEQTTSRQLVVVTLPSLGGYEIEDYSNQLLRHWQIGQKGLNNGALFVVVPSEHKVRIEVGYGLEPLLTDAMSSVILQRAVIPKFRAGDIQGGIVDGTGALIQQLSLDRSTAEAQAAAAADAPVMHHHHRSPLAGLIPLIIIFFVFSSIFRGRRGGGGGLGWILPLMFLGGGRGGGWGGGDGGGWGGGGGGFSGGGGSGGGGGASGGW
jgi:uncharacterized protein